MHTLIILTIGFVLLAVCLLVGKFTGGNPASLAKAALAFLPLWLIGSGINMWFGVAKAGYTIKEELPIFLVIFVIPTAAAIALYWKFKSGD